VSRDPFTPPAANVEAPEFKRGSAVKAVLVGLAVDIGGSIAFAFLFSIAYGIYLASQGQTSEQMQSAMATVGYDSPLGIVGMVVGSLFSVLGGYLCARIARHSEYRLGIVMCVATLVLIAFTGVGGDVHAIIAAGLVVMTLASIMIGIHIGVRQNRGAARA
jgi:hypothetical protein